jgi:broad specificity phosphatase PhoE
VPLTPRGREQAVRIAVSVSHHPFGAVLASPMQRALETARLAGFGARVELRADLREWDYGDDEGRTTDEIRRERPGWSLWRDGPQGGETIDQVATRADRLIAEVRSSEADSLCFGHGHCLRIVAARWLGLSGDHGRHFALAPAALSILGWEREVPVVELWNDAPGADPKS